MQLKNCPKCSNPLRISKRRNRKGGAGTQLYCTVCNNRRRRTIKSRPIFGTSKSGKYTRKYTHQLKDHYVRILLSGKSGIPPAAWSPEIVELKRARMILKRKELAKCQN